MNTFWSDKVQSTEILHYSRVQRINNQTKDVWLTPLNIKPNSKILEVGCGSGHFTNFIKEQFPTAEVVGIDLDYNHIQFAKEHSNGVTYMCADINDLPFESNSFDVVFSHTVVEHLPFKNFITEQKRVLKPNGKIVVFEVEPKNKHVSPFTYLKDEIYAILDKIEIDDSGRTNVGGNVVIPHEFLKNLELEGFENCSVEFKEIMYYYPDNTTKNIALEQIQKAKLAELYEYMFIISLSKNGEQFKDELINLTNKRYDKRVKLLNNNTKVYDYESTAIRIISATKKATN